MQIRPLSAGNLYHCKQWVPCIFQSFLDEKTEINIFFDIHIFILYVKVLFLVSPFTNNHILRFYGIKPVTFFRSEMNCCYVQQLSTKIKEKPKF